MGGETAIGRMGETATSAFCIVLALVRWLSDYYLAGTLRLKPFHAAFRGVALSPIRRFAHSQKDARTALLTGRASLLPLHAIPLSRSLPGRQRNDCRFDSRP